jgi:DNA-binding MarR family transcriptional regulator
MAMHEGDTTAGLDGAELGWQLSTAVVLFHEAIAQRLGLSAVEHKALGLITRSGPLTAGALAKQTGLTPGAITGLVDRLEHAGYVRRTPDPADRRRILVSATPAQRPDLTGVFDELGQEMAGFLAKYNERELAVIADWITNTIDALQVQTRRLTQDAAMPSHPRHGSVRQGPLTRSPGDQPP